jgi:DNA primase
VAGEKAAERSLGSLLAENLVVRVAEMPAGEDPDSMIRGKGAGAFTAQITGAKDFFDFQIDRLGSRPDFTTPRGKMQAARKMAGSISLIKDAVLRETVMHKVTQRLEISAQEFVKMLRAPSVNRDEEESPTPSSGAEPLNLDPTLRLLTLLALRDAPVREWLLAEPWDTTLRDVPDAELLMKVLGADLNPEDAGSVQVFLSTLNAAEEAAASGLLADGMPVRPMHIAHDCWYELERRRIRRRIEALKARIFTPNLPLDDLSKMQKEILDLQKRLSDIPPPLSPSL